MNNIEDKKFSFIIPVYNVSVLYLIDCIESIRMQNLINYEIIIVNDGSKMEELNNYCLSIAKERDIIYIEQENQGSAVARNVALDNATGDYIIFVDADDKLDLNFFNNLEEINEKDEILCFDYTFNHENQKEIKYTLNGGNNYLDKNDLISNVLFYPEKLDNLMFGALWAKIFSKKFLDDNNIRFKPQLRKSQDRAFMLEAYYKSTFVRYKPINSYFYTINMNSITHTINYKMVDYYEFLNNYILEFCINNNIKSDMYKFFTYSIFGEMLALTYFNSQCELSLINRMKEVSKLYNKFEIGSKLKSIKIKDFNRITGKIKFILYKYKIFILLNYYISAKG